jgi:hypothetical protein
MTLRAGWLDRQFANVNEEVREWPMWMRREAGFVERAARPHPDENHGDAVKRTKRGANVPKRRRMATMA